MARALSPGMKLPNFLTLTAALMLPACSSVAKDKGPNEPSSFEPAEPADLDHSPTPFEPMDATPAEMNEMDPKPSAQKTVYTDRDPFIAPTLSAACGWDEPTVFFATDSHRVGLVGGIKVELLATCLNNETLADDPIVLMGYADERGEDDYNRALGLRRANAVKSDLVAAGVSASRIETYSKGEYFVDGDDEFKDDRRVVIKLDK